MILHQYEEGKPCQGMNCGTTTAQHSMECVAEHAATLARGFFGKWLPIADAPENTVFDGWLPGYGRITEVWLDNGELTHPGLTHFMLQPPPPPSLNE
jgi:hypothetical protein